MHALLSLQDVTPVGVHVPPAHTSPSVQALPSVQGVPAKLLCPQPVTSLQVSPVQTLLSSHLPFAVPTHVPDAHTSNPVQKSPSLHVAPLMPVWVQPRMPAQASAVHGLPSSQSSFSAPTQFRPMQVSTAVHGSPSLQAPENGL